MKMNRAFWSGILGGVIISILLAIGRWAGLVELHLEMLVGTFATERGMNAFSIGAAMHLVFAGLLGLIYGRVFEAIKWAGTGAGALVGLIHALVVGGILGILSVLHPQLGVTMPDPGFFAANYGTLDVVGLFVTHLVYGIILGGLYEEPLSAGATNYKKV